jgi:hypothetical protein
VGVSFKASLSPDEVRMRYIAPLRDVLEESHAGIYTNYLCQREDDGDEATEYLLMFQIHDFQTGLRLLRITMEKLGPPPGMSLHNLNASEPLY